MNREVGIPSCVCFLPLQHLNSLGSKLEEKSVSCPVRYLYSRDEFRSLLLNVLHMCFENNSSIPTQTDSFSRSSKLKYVMYSPTHHWSREIQEKRVTY